MQEKLTMQQFMDLTLDRKQQYVLKTMNLESFWVMGYIRNPVDEKPFYFIEKLINPYTTMSLDVHIFIDISLNNGVYCSLPSGAKRLEDGTLVIAKVKLSNESKIKEGKIFSTTHIDVLVSENSDEILSLIEKTGMDLPIVALTRPAYYDRSNREFDELTNIVRNVAVQERESIKKLTEQENKKLEIQFKKLEAEEDNLNKKQEEHLQKEEEVLQESKKVNKKIAKLNELGFSIESIKIEDRKSELPKFDLPNKQSELIKLVQEQLALRGYYYESRFLRQLLLSLTTGQMIVLMGPSGTGKTTIIKQLADVIDANYEIIPVQPSWTDKQDLLGFYNPIRKLFVSTPFLDCLIKAKNNPDKLYFICLDEMNLAQIEYYLADILSIREVPDERLRLYSDFEYEQNLSEIRWFIQKVLKSNKSIEEAIADGDIDSMMHFEMASRYTNMQRYLPQLEIPSNIRIIGTMNVDGAVQAISPKIVDRSLIIPVMKQSKKEIIDSQKTIGRYPLQPAAFSSESTKNISSALRSGLNKIQQELTNLNITYNDRVEKHVHQYYNAAHDFEIKTKQQLDDLVVMKFFPRIHNTFEDAQIRGLIEQIKSELGEDSQAFKKLEHMQSRMKETSLLSYWS
ncbi:AAA family ATPase [Solibacillus daqui]|uniref:AAA family ATPase n=1 Tax=Solibacillus daqui TaxID=2912187 RepID=UPI0023673D60|nr:AAA family ATPase [Solibacillus daqui]